MIKKNLSHFASLREILDEQNVNIEISLEVYVQQQLDRKYCQQVNDDGTIEQMNDKLAQACIDGLKNYDIHNYPQPINMEVSLLSIFYGLYGITNEQIKLQRINNIRQTNKLSANVEMIQGQASTYGS
ncbi:MAG: hypothetical protein EZS28_034231 [Streblomastix strix]|uniref:Uncharacterized protein n=1 Tax=Streblomastix strix TaxID=222440 RepID=A0A5J4UJX8_9EUKA|nr:MAG: hypothetical protein EZS28_034231 [Streblomastix strix]